MDLYSQHIWQGWADKLQRWGLSDAAASLLEASGPLSVLGAQIIYLSQPLLGAMMPPAHWKALANLLEEPAQSQSFATYLRESTCQQISHSK